MILSNGSEYKAVLLDTNVFWNLLTSPEFASRFFSRFFSKSTKSLCCFSFYNVIELSNMRQANNGKIDIFQRFKEIFSAIPCLMFFSYKNLIQEEWVAAGKNTSIKLDEKIAFVHKPLASENACRLDEWLNRAFLWKDGAIASAMNDFILQLPDIVQSWEHMRSPIHISSCEFQRIYFFEEAKNVHAMLKSFNLDSKSPDYKSFPAIRTMLFSQTQRVHFAKKPLTKNDVMDVCTSAFAPYVDAVVTEARQADVYKKAKTVIPQLYNLEVVSIRDV